MLWARAICAALATAIAIHEWSAKRRIEPFVTRTTRVFRRDYTLMGYVGLPRRMQIRMQKREARYAALRVNPARMRKACQATVLATPAIRPCGLAPQAFATICTSLFTCGRVYSVMTLAW